MSKKPIIGQAYPVSQIYRPTPRTTEQAFGPGRQLTGLERADRWDFVVGVACVTIFVVMSYLAFSGVLK